MRVPHAFFCDRKTVLSQKRVKFCGGNSTKVSWIHFRPAFRLEGLVFGRKKNMARLNDQVRHQTVTTGRRVVLGFLGTSHPYLKNSIFRWARQLGTDWSNHKKTGANITASVGSFCDCYNQTLYDTYTRPNCSVKLFTLLWPMMRVKIVNARSSYVICRRNWVE